MSEKCHSILPRSKGRLLAHVASVSIDLNHRQVIPEHYHPEDQLIFASRGVMTVRTNKASGSCPRCAPSRYQPEHLTQVEMSGPVSMRTLYFHPGMVRAPPQRCFVMNVSSLLKELILYACELSTLTRRIALQRSLIDVMIAQLKIANAVPLQLPRPEDKRAARIVNTLLNHPSANQTLDQLCKVCGASKRTIQRIFLTETKMSFARWPAIKAFARPAITSLGRKGKRSRLGSGLQQSQRIYLNVQKTTGKNTDDVFQKRIKS